MRSIGVCVSLIFVLFPTNLEVERSRKFEVKMDYIYCFLFEFYKKNVLYDLYDFKHNLFYQVFTSISVLCML